MRTYLVLASLLLLSACRLLLVSPDTASIDSRTNARDCPKNTECRVDVVDFFFKDTFRARPDERFVFDGWRAAPRHLCGGQTGPCRLETAPIEGIPILEAVLFSDEAFYLTPNIRAESIFESLPCDRVPASSPLNPREATDKIEALNEHPHKCTYVADNLDPLPNDFGFDVRNILLFQLERDGELGAPGDIVYSFDLAADTLQGAQSAWPVLYIDIDADNNTGRQIRGIGADYRMHYNQNCQLGRSGLYEYVEPAGWVWVSSSNVATSQLSIIGNNRFLLLGVIFGAGFLSEPDSDTPPTGVITIEEFEGDCGAQTDYLEASGAFSISNFFD